MKLHRPRVAAGIAAPRPLGSASASGSLRPMSPADRLGAPRAGPDLWSDPGDPTPAAPLLAGPPVELSPPATP